MSDQNEKTSVASVLDLELPPQCPLGAREAFIGGIPLVELNSVSRVHLLLVQLGEELLAIDTASTNGTCRGRTRIETTTLDDVDSLELPSRSGVATASFNSTGSSTSSS